MLKRIGVVAVVVVAATYVSDYFWARYRIANPKSGDAFGSVMFYDSTTTKGGKVEIIRQPRP